MADLTFLPAVEMARQIREKKISPVELAEAHLAKIERLNPRLNAFVHFDPERVLLEARAAEDAVMNGEVSWPVAWRPDQHQGFDRSRGDEMRSGYATAERALSRPRMRLSSSDCVPLAPSCSG